MERCPVCGEPRRNAARFCTTCGARFPGSEPAASASDSTTPDPVTAAPASDTGGWPAPPAASTASPWATNTTSTAAASSWSTDSTTTTSAGGSGWPAPVAEADSTDEGLTWAEIAAAAVSRPKPAPAPAVVGPVEPADEAIAEFSLDELDESADSETASALRARARSLAEELRSVIDELTGAPTVDRDLVGEELRNALSRPAALDGNALADLQAAAEAAQERPRDLDTLTALTGHATTIQALIVGYERATAGIERVLDTISPGEPVPIPDETP